jgi:hypothetical protein
MKIAYVTTDEVNRYAADRLARACGAQVCCFSRQGAMVEGGFDAAVYDLDFLPGKEQRAVLTHLMTRPLTQSVAVHSYHLDGAQKRALRANGVVVYRRLVRKMFHLLLRRYHRGHVDCRCATEAIPLTGG